MKISSTELTLLSFLDCHTGAAGGAFNWIANGHCNDQNNNAYCSYDGGDCCGDNVDFIFCNPSGGLCQCIIGDTNHGECPNPAWIGDGYCDDVTNNQYCNYDGGDCCGSAINTQYCSECQCLNWLGSNKPGVWPWNVPLQTRCLVPNPLGSEWFKVVIPYCHFQK